MFNRLVLIILILGSFVSQSQEDKDKRLYIDQGKRLYCEAYSLPSASKDSIDVIVLFRYSQSLLSFKKSSSNPNNFESFPQFEIEIKDTNGIIKKRESIRDTIVAMNYDETISKTQFHYGFKLLKLPSGSYNITSQLFDNGKNKVKEFKFPELKKMNFFNGNQICEPFFCKAANSNETVLAPYILNHNAAFSSDPTKIILPVVFKGEFVSYNYSIEYIEHKLGNLNWGDELKIKGKVTSDNEHFLAIHPKSGPNGVFLKYNQISKAVPLFQDYHTGLVEIELPADKNIPGTYQLALWQDNRKDTVHFNFKIEWEDMPITLRSVDRAIESMYYILTDNEFSEMKKGNDQKMFRKLLDYWRPKDPTPFTVFNEAMNEYFRRVDYSVFNYKTLTESDGSKTERGKIYILNGKPTKSSRKIGTDNKIIENWTYQNLKKEFLFETNAKGQFSLIKVNEIK